MRLRNGGVNPPYRDFEIEMKLDRHKHHKHTYDQSDQSRFK